MAGPKNARQKVIDLATREFLKHWGAVLKRIEAGTDVANSRKTAFLAGNKEEKLKAAKRFYSRQHARKLASMAPEAVYPNLAPWLDQAIEYALFAEDTSVIRQLTHAEYVVVFAPTHDPYPDEPAYAHPFPDDSVVYGDLYEISASGFSSGGTMRIFKSTGESFTDEERDAAEKGIRRNFYANADEDGVDEEQWSLEFYDVEDVRFIEVEVTEQEGEEGEDEDT